MMEIAISKAWQTQYPGALMGVMILQNVANPSQNKVLDEKKAALEKALRSTIASKTDLDSSPVIQAYSRYYKYFRKNYHVQFQVESIALKGKSIPKVAALVEAMFMAELKNMLLTAGHDVDKIEGDLTLGIADGTEKYLLMNGSEQILKAGDMFIADDKGTISSIIYGPDKHTRMTEKTKNALFTVYAPPGIGAEQVRQHLQEIKELVGLFSPEMRLELIEVYEAKGE
jgi:DNA/RNA-binding domain of Phe-tRNA-synthetase-like protein